MIHGKSGILDLEMSVRITVIQVEIILIPLEAAIIPTIHREIIYHV
jgi:hypothetical protein